MFAQRTNDTQNNLQKRDLNLNPAIIATVADFIKLGVPLEKIESLLQATINRLPEIGDDFIKRLSPEAILARRLDIEHIIALRKSISLETFLEKMALSPEEMLTKPLIELGEVLDGHIKLNEPQDTEPLIELGEILDGNIKLNEAQDTDFEFVTASDATPSTASAPSASQDLKQDFEDRTVSEEQMAFRDQFTALMATVASCIKQGMSDKKIKSSLRVTLSCLSEIESGVNKLSAEEISKRKLDIVAFKQVDPSGNKLIKMQATRLSNGQYMVGCSSPIEIVRKSSTQQAPSMLLSAEAQKLVRGKTLIKSIVDATQPQSQSQSDVEVTVKATIVKASPSASNS